MFYFRNILEATKSIPRLFTMFSKGSASSRRITEIMSLPEDMPSVPCDIKTTGYHVAFENVSFSYGSAKFAVERVSFSLKRGETLGILGETGCGKSTLIQLLMRFYDVNSGVIRIDGENIRGIPPERLYSIFGIAFQNDSLHANTIYENIDFGRNLGDESVSRAATSAQAMGFINASPEGLARLLVPRGANLSGGQRQRLLIARALAANPEILILDDSSSALDYATDLSLRNALRNNFQSSTKIIIAQRVHSIMSADKILVLERGRTAGYGSHEYLIQTCEVYREILASQTDGPGGGAIVH
jgi:ATP-binding cassette subfamily B protein